MGVNTSRNDPLRGQKGHLHEGGIRIPFFAMWPGAIPKGQVSNVPVISLDIAATAVALAGAKPRPDRPLDGVDLMPLLTGKSSSLPSRNLFWRVKNQRAIRSGDWKYLKLGDQPPELYNLAADIGEKNNLISREPERAEQLRRALDNWLETLPPPAW
jgi:arylsulfatase A-like enzyme